MFIKQELPKKDGMYIRKSFQQYRAFCHKILKANLQEIPLSDDVQEAIDQSLDELTVCIEEYFGINIKLEYEEMKDYNKVSMLTYAEFQAHLNYLIGANNSE